MHPYAIFLLASPLATTVAAQSLNTSQEFYLHTELKPGQEGKEGFDNLWLYASHTGAGFNDAMFSIDKANAIPGFLNASNLTTADGAPLYGAEFDLGTEGIQWTMEPEISVNIYAAWEPVRINIGGAPTEYSAFFINETGLQWTNVAESSTPDSFGGWFGEWHPSRRRRVYRTDNGC